MMHNESQSKILVIHTGGTFGANLSSESEHGALSSALEQDLRLKVPEIFQTASVSFHVHCQSDSSNLSGHHWAELCSAILSQENDYDGFVVIHGTDTLAFGASFVSLAIQKLRKPIVFTGSQRPLNELRSDARMNLIDAVELACMPFPEVMVCFHSEIFLASRVTKTSNLNLGAFNSPNFPKLGSFGVDMALNLHLLPSLHFEDRKPIADLRFNDNIVNLSAIPGVSLHQKVADALIESVSGIVLEGFGMGHFPTLDDSWIDLCNKAFDADIPVVVCSQCGIGRVDLSIYSVGRELEDTEVISAGDMTRECATIKLMMFLGRGLPFDERHSFFARPISREVSERGASMQVPVV